MLIQTFGTGSNSEILNTSLTTQETLIADIKTALEGKASALASVEGTVLYLMQATVTDGTVEV